MLGITLAEKEAQDGVLLAAGLLAGEESGPKIDFFIVAMIFLGLLAGWVLVEMFYDRYFLTDLLAKLKRRIWHKHLRLWWHRLWIREDEFDRSLDMDPMAMLEMNEKEREAYINDLCRRREIAHRRDLERSEVFGGTKSFADPEYLESVWNAMIEKLPDNQQVLIEKLKEKRDQMLGKVREEKASGAQIDTVKLESELMSHFTKVMRLLN